MNLLSPVSEIMTSRLITASENDPLKKIDEIFKENRIHHVPIIDKGNLVGMISKSDHLFFKRGFNQEDKDLAEHRLNNHYAKEIMTTKLAKLEPTDRINVALEVFRENLFHAIPVVDNGALVGIVTTLDIIQNIVKDEALTKEY